MPSGMPDRLAEEIGKAVDGETIILRIIRDTPGNALCKFRRNSLVGIEEEYPISIAKLQRPVLAAPETIKFNI